jgi:hypothetical protein
MYQAKRALACGGAGGPAGGGDDAVAPVGPPPEEHDALGVVAVREPDQAPHHSVPGPRPDRDGERQAAAGLEQVLHAAPRSVHGLLLRRHEEPHRRGAARPDVVRRPAVSLQQLINQPALSLRARARARSAIQLADRWRRGVCECEACLRGCEDEAAEGHLEQRRADAQGEDLGVVLDHHVDGGVAVEEAGLDARGVQAFAQRKPLDPADPEGHPGVPRPSGQDEDEQRQRRARRHPPRHLERDAAAGGLRVQLHVPPRPAPLGLAVRVVVAADAAR